MFKYANIDFKKQISSNQIVINNLKKFKIKIQRSK